MYGLMQFCDRRSSGGEAEGYRGSRKKSPFAGQLAAEKAAERALLKGVRSVRVRVKGVGARYHPTGISP